MLDVHMSLLTHCKVRYSSSVLKMKCDNRNSFCFVCGLFTPKTKFRNITATIVKAYQEYFQMTYKPNLWYTPEIVCDYCHRSLAGFHKKDRRPKYVFPMTWLPRTEHLPEQCYFCLNHPGNSGVRYSTRENLTYIQVESIIPAELRTENNLFSPLELFAESEDIEMESDNILDHASTSQPISSTNLTEESKTRSEYDPSIGEAANIGIQHLITQADFNDLARDLNLSKRNTEILGSRLKQWNLVSQDFKISAVRKRFFTESFDRYFEYHEEMKIAYCNDIDELFNNIGHPHDPNEWRLFVDSSVTSLKGVLLHIGNEYPSIPILYGIDLKETHETIKLVLELIKYEEHGWKICSDLKIVGILQGLKGGFAKHQCFLCHWEGRKRDLHYTNYHWDPRPENTINAQHSRDKLQLVPHEKIIIPPLHIKLGLIRNFTRALDAEGNAFSELKKLFPKLSTAKIEAGKVFESFPRKFLYLKHGS